MTRSAVVIGGTGAVGQYVVAELLQSAEYAKVVVLGRRQYTAPSDVSLTDEQRSKLDSRVVDLGNADGIEEHCAGVEDAFCCLGTTRADAGSAEEFRRVDYGMSSNFAHAAHKAGVKTMALLTSQGANPNSWLLYPRTKGETEQEFRSIGFERLAIFQPGLLDRSPNARFVERLVLCTLPLASSWAS